MESKTHKIFLREEFFGSILYNTLDKSYYFFDHETNEAYKKILKGEFQCESLQEFRDDLLEQDLLSSDVSMINNSREGFLSAPLRVFIDITYLCNLRCKHCFTDSRLEKEEELTTQDIMHLIDQMRISGTFLLSIAGGEPILRKDIYEVIEYANNNDVDVSFTTNATRITEDVAKRLEGLRLRTITVSIDGMEENHDQIRGKGQFKRAVEGLRILRKHCTSANISVKNTVNATNMSEYEQLIRLAEELELDSIKFNPIRLFGRTIQNRQLLINQDQYIKFLNDVQNVDAKIPVSIPKTPLDDRPYEFVPIGFGCTGGKETCNITPTGEFSACAFLGSEYVVGNVKKESFLDLWKKTNMTVDYEGNSTCKSCSEYNQCRGGCRSRALFECGDINAVDPLCTLKRQQEGGNKDNATYCKERRKTSCCL